MNNRSLATRRVMKTVARRAPRSPLPVRHVDGSFPIVVALPDDKLAKIGELVRNQFNGRANVFVPFSDRIALIDFQLDPCEQTGPEPQQAHAETSMAMYVEFLKMSEGPATLTVSMGSTTSVDVQDIAYAF